MTQEQTARARREEHTPQTRERVLSALRNFGGNGEKVIGYSGEREGPSVLVAGGMHGNETLGVLVADMLREELETGRMRLLSGTVRILLGNPRAIEANERTVPGRADMNRILTPEVLRGEKELGWEGSRARVIAGAARISDIGIDLHSTNRPSPAFICASSSERHRAVYKWFPRIAVVTDPDRIISGGGGSLDEFVDDCGGTGICYESGQALDMSNVRPVFEAVKAVLIERRMIDGVLPVPSRGAEFRVAGFVPYIPESEFIFAEGKAHGFAPVALGESIGTRLGEDVRSEIDGIILFPKEPAHQAQSGVVTYLAERTGGREGQ